MFSREIIHMYRTGATDPDQMLAQLMKKAYEEPSSEEENGDENGQGKKHNSQRPRNPNLSCFQEKKEKEYLKWVNLAAKNH